MVEVDGGLCCKQESGRPPANRPTLPPVELRGGKLGASTRMVHMMAAQLELQLEDITGPIDAQQVHRPAAPHAALSPASNHLGLGPRRRTSFWSVAVARQEG